VDDHYCYRNITANFDASGSLFIGGLAWNVDVTGNKEGGSAAADVDGFVFKWDLNNCAMGICGFEASASFDYTPKADGSGSVIYSYSLAFAEFFYGH
jgi:hypothetical protein